MAVVLEDKALSAIKLKAIAAQKRAGHQTRPFALKDRNESAQQADEALQHEGVDDVDEEGTHQRHDQKRFV